MGRAAGQRDLHFYVAAAVGRLLRLSHMPGWNIRMRISLASLLMASLTIVASGQERDRSKVPEKYKWNLADIYPDLAAWRAAKEKVAAEPPKIRAFQGKLASSPAVLADALDLGTRLDQEVSRIYVYASMLADQDTRESEPQGMQQEMQQLTASFGAAESFIEPEILKAGAATVEKFIASEPRLKVYTFYLRDILRRAPHTLTDNEEKILADASPMAASAVEHLRHPLECRLPVSDRHAERR